MTSIDLSSSPDCNSLGGRRQTYRVQTCWRACRRKRTGDSGKINWRTSSPIRNSATFSQPAPSTVRDYYSRQTKWAKPTGVPLRWRSTRQVGIPIGGPAIRFDQPIRAWVCGESGRLFVRPSRNCCSAIPAITALAPFLKMHLLEVVPARGTPEFVDTIRVRHSSGGSSTIGLKSYSQGRERFPGRHPGPNFLR